MALLLLLDVSVCFGFSAIVTLYAFCSTLSIDGMGYKPFQSANCHNSGAKTRHRCMLVTYVVCLGM